MGHNDIVNDVQVNAELKGLIGSRTIAVYTVLLVLSRMRERLGVEAMVEFIDRYTATIERLDPEIKDAVNHELLERALHGLYQSGCSYEE
jgi:hypothetical protein